MHSCNFFERIGRAGGGGRSEPLSVKYKVFKGPIDYSADQINSFSGIHFTFSRASVTFSSHSIAYNFEYRPRRPAQILFV